MYLYSITERLCIYMSPSPNDEIEKKKLKIEKKKLKIDIESKISVPKDVLEQAKKDISVIDSAVLKFRTKNSLNISRKAASMVHFEELELIYNKILSSTTLNVDKIESISESDKGGIFSKLSTVCTVVGNIVDNFANNHEAQVNEFTNENKELFKSLIKEKTFRSIIDGNGDNVINDDSNEVNELFVNAGDSAVVSLDSKKIVPTSKEIKLAEKYLKDLKKAVKNFEKSLDKDKKIISKNHINEKESEKLYESVSENYNRLVLEAKYYKGTKKVEELENYAEKANGYILKYTSHSAPKYNIKNLQDCNIPTKYIAKKLEKLQVNEYIFFVENTLEDSCKQYNEFLERLSTIKINIKTRKKNKDTNASSDLNEILEKIGKLKRIITNLRSETEVFRENFSTIFDAKLKKSVDKLSGEFYYSKLDEKLSECYDLKYKIKYGENNIESDPTYILYMQIKEVNSRLDRYRELIKKFALEVARSKSIEDISKSYKKLRRFKKFNIDNALNGIEPIICRLEEGHWTPIEKSSDAKNRKLIKKLRKLYLKISKQVEKFVNSYELFSEALKDLMYSKTLKGRTVAFAKKVIYVVGLLSSVLTNGVNVMKGLK